jgi:uncharacterized protein
MFQSYLVGSDLPVNRTPAGSRPTSLTPFACNFYNATQVLAGPAHGQAACSGCRAPVSLSPSGESEAAVPVQMELKRIIISEVIDHQMIWLKEVDGERVFPIVIGIFEATSIDRRVKKMNSPRPLTHDLIANVVESLGAEIQDIYINELRDHTYFAKLRIRQNGELVEIDSRPSDAIALAVTANVPIYVAEDVINEACGD